MRLQAIVSIGTVVHLAEGHEIPQVADSDQFVLAQRSLFPTETQVT